MIKDYKEKGVKIKRLNLLPIIFLILVVFMPVKINAGTSRSSKVVNEVAEQYWKYMLKTSVYFRRKQGIKIEQLPRFSLKEENSRMEEILSMLEILREVKPGAISYEKNLSRRILLWVLQNLLEEHRFFLLKIPIASYISPIPHINRLYTRYEFREPGDPDHYLHLLEQYPGFIRDIHTILKQQLRAGIILPKPALEPAVSYIETLCRPPGESFLYVKKNRLKNGKIFQGTGDVDEFQKKAAGIIASSVNPALKEMTAFIKGDYLKNAPGKLGLWQYPNGKEYYKFLVKFRTTLDLTPEKVHETGLLEIEKLRKKLDAVRKELKFKGDLEAFLLYLKSDPRFIPKSPEEMGERLMFHKKHAEAKLPLFFSTLPAAPCAVKRLNPRLEKSMTYGYYQPPMGSRSDPNGYYWYNASHLERKNSLLVSSAALILHELVPGHHLQVCLQSENETLPLFRREYYLTPYAEGWAEYGSHLGEEMGVYKDPYERCGRIMMDIFLSVRMVVDTGMNYFKWTRKKAVEFMKKHTLLSDVEISSEIFRYTTGIQAHTLGYRMGFLKMMELRRNAETELGSKFDIRSFHETLLGKGTMPLSLLEEHVDHYIKVRRKKQYQN